MLQDELKNELHLSYGSWSRMANDWSEDLVGVEFWQWGIDFG